MLIRFLLIAVLTSGLASPLLAQKYADPASYNNAIVDEQRLLLKKNLRYISKMAHSENERKIEARRVDVIEQIETSLRKLTSLPAYDGDVALRDNAARAFREMRDVYADDYRKLAGLATTRMESVEVLESYYKAMEVAEARLQTAGDSVESAQQRFAKRHKMTIITSPEDKKLQGYIVAVSQVSAYQHRVEVAQFRLTKPIAALMEALNAQDAPAFAIAREQLKAGSEQAVADLTALAPFRGKDPRYRDSAKSLARFYAGLCASQFVQMHALLERKDELNKAEADRFNGYIATYNAQNQKLTEAYNKAGSSFLSTYVPEFND